jgi:putative acetyltransferase
VLNGAGAHYTAAERRAWVSGPAEPPWIAERLAAGHGWMAGRAGHGDEGLLTATAPDDAGPLLLDLFYVRPAAQGSGVASALLAAFDGAAAGRPCTTFASLCLRPILEARGWRVVRPDPVARGDETLMRFVMERP